MPYINGHLPVQTIGKNQLMSHLHTEGLHRMLWSIIERTNVTYKLNKLEEMITVIKVGNTI